MLILFETSGGFALFQVTDKKLKKVEDLASEFESLDSAARLVKLSSFSKFKDAKVALEEATALSAGKIGRSLKKFLRKNIIKKQVQESLLVIDKRLKKAVEETLGIKALYSSKYLELIRGIRSQLEGLLAGFSAQEQRAMSLGLAHSICRHTLKFSVDKIDTMVVQAVNLLDDLDKELNNYAMRLKEWYSWHFPEILKILSDNLIFAKVVLAIGKKENTMKVDLSEIISPELEDEIKVAAKLSMGTEITDEDVVKINSLCNQVISLSEYRQTLSEYLKTRMNTIAPNLTVLVGELVGARLIAHAGSLVNLAKHPASTIQILGAEKALFRAIKSKHDTPKYGLIYHASIIGGAAPNIKGKISRSLAAKCALSVRMDAHGDNTEATIGKVHKDQIEGRVRYLESLSSGQMVPKQTKKYQKFEENPSYNPVTDSTVKIEVPQKRERASSDEKTKKKKKRD